MGGVDSGPQRPALILGSSSPRRRELLAQVGLRFTVMKPDTEERPRPGELPLDYVQRNADEKGAWVRRWAEAQKGIFPLGGIVVSADTIVVLGADILEKPQDAADAVVMLRRLSGQEHTVISGVSLRTFGSQPSQVKTFAVRTSVRIKALSEREIKAYVRTGEPLDKAGAYAAQGIGSYMVERIQGSYANVVGLPIAEVVNCLEKDFSYPLFDD